MIGAVEIMAAMTVWENEEWSGLAKPVTSFQYFPTNLQHQTTLYPYICHQVEESGAIVQSVNHLGSVEDEQWHRIWVYVMFCADTDPLAIQSERDAIWRDRYRTGFLKHTRQGIISVPEAGIASSVMGTISPSGLDLFNRKDIGIMVPVTVTVRQSMERGD